jgi:hypothetical protein
MCWWFRSPLRVTCSLPHGTVGRAYRATLTASGGKAPYTWAVWGLPRGLLLQGDTITGDSAVSGTFSIKVQVRDKAMSTASATLSLVVAPAALEVTTTSLPEAQVGVAYSASLAATGGVPPYSWTATGLPAGLTCAAGVISGTPTTAGTDSVVVTVTDS